MLLLALLIIVLYLCSKVLIPFLSTMLWASVLAVVFNPAHRWVNTKLPNSPSLASGATTGLVLFAIILPLIAVALAVGTELQTTMGEAPAKLVQMVQEPESSYAHPVRKAWRIIHKRLGLTDTQIREQAQELATNVSALVIKGTVSFVGGLVQLVVALAMMVFTLFYLFRDGERMVTLALDWIPLDPVRSRKLFYRVADLIHASVYGIVVIAVIQGSLGGLAFWALDLPSPLLWTVVMSVMATIPMLGTFVVWIPAAIYLVAVGAYTKALALTIWGTLVIGLADNLLRPRLVGQRTSMHELLIFFSVLGGLNAFGLLGVLMGPVLMALGTALLTAFRATDHPDLLAP